MYTAVEYFAYGGPPLKIFACGTSLAGRPNFPPPADQGNRRLPDFSRRRPPHPPARREHWTTFEHSN
jgi:hypothetical protein